MARVNLIPEKVLRIYWALLNKHSYDLAMGKKWTPLESWKRHQRPLLDAWGIGGSLQDQTIVLLGMYESARSGGWRYMTSQVFMEIDVTVNTAVVSWALHGSRSPADPVNGAVDFTDAEGLYYTPDCKGKPANTNDLNGNGWLEFNEIGAIYDTTRRDQDALEKWRIRCYSDNTTRIYQIGIDPRHENAPIYTFTRFKQPDYPWP